MKVILLQDIDNLGKEGDIKDVADGYVRNFLLPQKLVVIATEKLIEELEIKKELDAKKAEEELKATEEMVSQIDGQEVEIAEKIKDTGKIYGSITPLKISQALKKKGFNINKTQISIKEPIKKLGEYSVTVNFDHGLEAEIKVIVTEEKES